MKKLKIRFFTIFPEVFPGVLGISILKTAMDAGIWEYKTINLRDFGYAKHRKVDDTPFGGGAGLVMRPDVISDAIDNCLMSDSINIDKVCIIFTSAGGKVFNQKIANRLSVETEYLYIVCGRFEGIDQRVIEYYKGCEISIGQYVLCGGEVASMVICEGVIRLLDGVLGNKDTLLEESYSLSCDNSDDAIMLEYPQYTQPRKWREISVPEVLLSGNHAKIKEWRAQQSSIKTKIILEIK